jgi:hypothetical protein
VSKSLRTSDPISDTLPASGVRHPFRHVELDIDIGADAKDWSAVAADEKLKPVETELRRIEEMVSEIVSEMDYLRSREQKLRDTNESTNTRVKWFAFATMGMLVSLGVWQIVYLRAYFRYVVDTPWRGTSVLTCSQVKASYLGPRTVLLQKSTVDGGCGTMGGFTAMTSTSVTVSVGFRHIMAIPGQKKPSSKSVLVL